MENRLIHFSPDPPPKGPAPRGPEKAPETEKFNGDGKKEYAAIAKDIAGLKDADFNPQKLGEIFAKIDALHTNLLRSELGILNTHMDGRAVVDLIGKLKDRFLAYLRDKTGQDVKLYGEGSLDSGEMELPQGIDKFVVLSWAWMADAEAALNELFASTPEGEKWSESKVLQTANAIHNITTSFPYLFTADQVRGWFKRLSSRYDDKAENRNKELSAWLEYQKEHFTFTVQISLEWLEKPARDLFQSESSRLLNLGKSVEKEGDVDKFLKDFGSVEDNKIVSEILNKSHIEVEGNSEFPDARENIYMMLFWSYYRGLMTNPKVGEAKKAEVLAKYDETAEKYGQIISFRGRQELSEDLVKDLDGEDPEIVDAVANDLLATSANSLPLIPGLKVTPGQEALNEELSNQSAEIVFKAESMIVNLEANGEVTKEDVAAYSEEVAKLREKLNAVFGQDYIVTANPDFESKALDVLAMYDKFAETFQNAAMLPEYRKALDEFSEKKPGDYDASGFKELENIYSDLRDMPDYMPSEKLLKELKRLRQMAFQLYSRWAAALGQPPRAITSPRPFVPGRKDIFDEEGNEYVFSPFIDKGGDESLESFEIPEKLDLQLNYLHLMESFAQGFLAVDKMNEDNKGQITGVVEGFSKIEETMKAYYFDPVQYDGEKPFDLDGAIASNQAVSGFVANMKRLLITEAPLKLQFASGSPLIGEASEFEKFIDFLDDQHDDSNIQRIGGQVLELRKSPFFADVKALFNGSKDFNRDQIKQAGAAIAIFVREAFRNYVLFRKLSVQLFQAHLPGAIDKVPPAVRQKLRREAHSKALTSVVDYMSKGGGANMAKGEIRNKILADYEKEHGPGQRPDEETLEAMVQSGYDRFFTATLDAQTEVVYEMLLNHEAFKPEYIAGNFFRPEAADFKIYEHMKDSLHISEGFFEVSDEAAETFRNIGKFLSKLAEEIALLGISILISGGVGYVMRAALLGRMALGANRLRNVCTWAYRGLVYTGSLAVESGLFLQIYPSLKGEKTLMATLEKDGWGAMFERLAGEMMVFGAFHAVSFGARFLKFGKEGRQLLRLKATNPELSKQVDAVFSGLKGLNGAEGMVKMEEMLTKGVWNKKIGKFVKLEDRVAGSLRAADFNVRVLQEEYFRLLEGVQDSNLRKALGFMVQDLGFDMVAMILGTLAKEGIYKDPSGHSLDLTQGDTWFQMYTMGFAFRGAFCMVGKGAEKLPWLKGKSPIDVLPEVREAAAGALAKVNEVRTSFETKIEPLRAKAEAAKAEVAKLDGEIQREAQSAGKDPAEIPALNKKLEQLAEKRAESTKLERELEPLIRERDARLNEAESAYKAAEKRQLELEESIESAPLGDYPVSSRISRIMPKWLRKHLHSHYVSKPEAPGERPKFLGSDGFRALILNGDKGFEQAMSLINTAKRSILSVNDVLFVASQLPAEKRMEFLQGQKKIMTPAQKTLFLQRAETMTIMERDIPADFIAANPVPRKIRNNPRARSRFLTSRWRRFVIGTFLALGIHSAAFASPRGQTELPNRPAVMAIAPKAENFMVSAGKEAIFAPTKHEVSKMSRASEKSEMILFEVKPAKADAPMAAKSKAFAGIGWEGVAVGGDRLAGMQNLFSNNWYEDQNSINTAIQALPGEAGKEQFFKAKGAGAYFDSIPEALKPYIRVIGIYEDGTVKPHVVVDQKGLNEWAKANLNEETFPTFQTLKDLDLMQENITDGWVSLDPLLRVAYDFGSADGVGGFLFMWWLIGSGIQIGARVAGGRPKEKKEGTKIIMPTKWSVLMYPLKGLWNLALFPMRRLDFDKPPVPKETEAMIKDLPSVKDILAEEGKDMYDTMPEAMRTKLETDVATLKENYQYFSFTSDVQGKALFKALVKHRYYEMRMEAFEQRKSDLTAQRSALGAEITTLEGNPNVVRAKEIKAEIAALEPSRTKLTQLQGDPAVVRAVEIRDRLAALGDPAAELAIMEANANVVRGATIKSRLAEIAVAQQQIVDAKKSDGSPLYKKPHQTKGYKALEAEKSALETDRSALESAETNLDTKVTALEKRRAEKLEKDNLETEQSALVAGDATLPDKVNQHDVAKSEVDKIGTLDAERITLDSADPSLTTNIDRLEVAKSERDAVDAEFGTIDPEISKLIGKQETIGKSVANLLATHDLFSPRQLMTKEGVEKTKNAILDVLRLSENFSADEIATAEKYLNRDLPKLQAFFRKYPDLPQLSKEVRMAKLQIAMNRPAYLKAQEYIKTVGGKPEASKTPREKAKLRAAEEVVKQHEALEAHYNSMEHTWIEAKNGARELFGSIIGSWGNRFMISAAGAALLSAVMVIFGNGFGWGRHEDLEPGTEGSGPKYPGGPTSPEHVEDDQKAKFEERKVKDAGKAADGVPTADPPPGAERFDPNKPADTSPPEPPVPSAPRSEEASKRIEGRVTKKPVVESTVPEKPDSKKAAEIRAGAAKDFEAFMAK